MDQGERVINREGREISRIQRKGDLEILKKSMTGREKRWGKLPRLLKRMGVVAMEGQTLKCLKRQQHSLGGKISLSVAEERPSRFYRPGQHLTLSHNSHKTSLEFSVMARK